MRVSQLVETLQQLQAKHGDKTVYVCEHDSRDGIVLKELQDRAVKHLDYHDGFYDGAYRIGAYTF